MLYSYYEEDGVNEVKKMDSTNSGEEIIIVEDSIK